MSANELAAPDVAAGSAADPAPLLKTSKMELPPDSDVPKLELAPDPLDGGVIVELNAELGAVEPLLPEVLDPASPV